MINAWNLRATINTLRSQQWVDMAKKYRQEKWIVPRKDLNAFAQKVFSIQRIKDNYTLLRKLLPEDVLYVEMVKLYRNEPSLLDQDVAWILGDSLY